MKKRVNGWVVVFFMMLAVLCGHCLSVEIGGSGGAQAVTAAKSAFSVGTSMVMDTVGVEDPCERDGGTWVLLPAAAEGHVMQISVCDYGYFEELPLPYGDYSSTGEMIIQRSGYYKVETTL